MLSPGLAHSGDSLAQRSMGGSETAGIRMAAALAKRGHQVTIFSPGGTGIHDHVAYRPIEEFAAYANGTPHDVTIISRALESLRITFASKLTVLWVHDLALRRNAGALAGVLWNLDAIYTPSAWMKQQYVDTLGIPESTFLVTRNGVDLASFYPLVNVPRDPFKLVYGSRPERGLENVLAIMELLHQRGSKAYCCVSWYENTPPHLEAYYQHLWQRASQMPNVKLLGPLKQADWHREIASARALIYPGVQSDFREISCIAAMESMACGTPVVTCHKGALPETLHPACATFVGDEQTDVHSPAYRAQFADAVEALLADDVTWRSMSSAARIRASMFDWDGVAEQWEAHWWQRLAVRGNDDWRRRQHCVRTGEREGLAALVSA